MPSPRDTLLRAALQLALFTALFFPAEALWPAHARVRARRGLATDVAHALLNPLFINAGAALAMAGLALGARSFVPAALPSLVARQPFVAQVAEAFVLSELFAYLAHRAAHAVPWLWKLHRVHHASESLDYLAASRQHPLDAVLQLAIANLPCVALGVSLSALTTFLLLQRLHTVFVHANLRLRFGPIARVLATPQFHHWHHAMGARANYGAATPLFDWLFGTLHAERERFPTAYGVDERVPEGWLAQLLLVDLEPFKVALRRSRARAVLRLLGR